MSLQYKKIERLVKGFANHRRIQILELLEKNPGLSVDNISQNLDVNFVTIADHTRKLYDFAKCYNNKYGASKRNQNLPKLQKLLHHRAGRFFILRKNFIRLWWKSPSADFLSGVHDGALIESEVAGNLSCRPVFSFQKLRRLPSHCSPIFFFFFF